MPQLRDEQGRFISGGGGGSGGSSSRGSALERVVLNSEAMRMLLRGEIDPRLRADLERRAGQVMAGAAGHTGTVDPTPMEYEMQSYVGHSRVRVTVATANEAARAGEATHHTLVAAFQRAAG